MKKREMKKITRAIRVIIALLVIALTVGLSFWEIDWSQLAYKPLDEIIIGRAEEILQGEEISEPLQNVEDEQLENIPFVPGETLTLYFFDVGQADCILLECGGEYMLIDAGNNPDGKLIVQYLKSMGITGIDYIIGTHTHEDHIGGLDNVINSFDVGVLYMPANDYDSATYDDVIKAVRTNGVDKIAPEIGDIFFVGSARCEVMSIENENENINETSIVLEVEYGSNKFLFMGDAEIENEEKRLWNDVDVLKVGHHGSSTSTGEDFMEQIRPEIALISVGEDNTYGHPHAETIELLQDHQVDIYRTDLYGTIVITSDGVDCVVQTFDSIDLDGNSK